jgi:hypothetical protein
MIRLQHIDNNHPNATAKDAQNAMSQHWRTSVARVGDAGDIPPGILLDHHVVRHVTGLEAIHTLRAPRSCRPSSPAATSPALAPHLKIFRKYSELLPELFRPG